MASTSDIQSIEKSLTGREATNDDLLLQIQPNFNYVDQIFPAPMAINALGQLSLLAAESTDFNMTKGKETKHLRYEYFQANLMQICNSGHNAFQEAHHKMDGIRQQTSRLPDSLKHVVTVLVEGNREARNMLLPDALSDIDEIAKSALKNAESIRDKFQTTQDQISEMLELCMESRGQYQTQKEEIEIQKKQIEMEKEIYEQREKNYKEAKEKLKKDLDKRVNDYDKALESVPSGWKCIGMDFVQSLAHNATEIISAPVNISKGLLGGMKHSGQMVRDKVVGSSKQETRPEHDVPSMKQKKNQVPEQTQSQFSTEDIDYLRMFQQIVDNLNNLTKKMEKSGKKTEDPTIFREVQVLLKNSFAQNRSSASAKLQKETEEFYTKIQDTINDQYENWQQKELEKAKNELLSIAVEAGKFASRYNYSSGTMPLQYATPYVSSMPSISEGSSASQIELVNAQFKVENTRNMLESMQERYDKTNDEFLKNNEKLNKMLLEFAKIDVESATFDDILEMLKKGLVVLGDLKDKWSQITDFFRSMSCLMDSSLSVYLKKVVDLSTNADKLKKEDTPLEGWLLDVIYKNVRNALAYGYVVNRMAEGYHNISTNFLMEPVSSLGKLMVETDKQRIKSMKFRLNESSMEAQTALIGFKEEERIRFKETIDKRMIEVSESYKAVTNMIDSDTKAKIEEISKVEATHETLPAIAKKSSISISINTDDFC